MPHYLHLGWGFPEQIFHNSLSNHQLILAYFIHPLGIGKAIATAFAKCKAEKVYALAKTKEDLEQLASEVPNIVPVVADLCDWDATKKAVEAVGRIDILINNAGVASLESFVDVKPESFDMWVWLVSVPPRKKPSDKKTEFKILLGRFVVQ